MRDLRLTNTDLNIEIAGINAQTDVSYNSLLIAQSPTLPWLQDTADQNVWQRWGVTWRDVRILDSRNRLVGVYNLTSHDLADPNNVLALKQLLLAAAISTDSDGDGLPDDWEWQYFGNLSAGPEQDSDGDGVNNFLEYAFGTDPGNRSTFSSLRPISAGSPAAARPSFAFRRRAGSMLNYVVETSTDFQRWTPATPDVLSMQAPRNLFDGTGTCEVICSPTAAGLAQPMRFLRVRATPRS